MTRIAPLVLSLLLVACALALVLSQYRSRVLFAELEVAQQDTKTLDAEGSRLRSELGRASQPAIIEAVARRLGLRALNPDRIVMLPTSAANMPSAVAPSAK
ncbi:MAG TPA: cell division protein FtsL, partial [Burkholderiaceae bacterium]|nr:cell division protein FtsL [Burkholderiaceae bacterium]